VAQPIALSSPIPDQIGKTKAVIVGTVNSGTGLEGEVYAVSLRTGRVMSGWPVQTPGGIGVNSTPSIDGNKIYVGVGNAADNNGGYLAVSASRHARAWYSQVGAAPGSSRKAGVQGSIAVGDLDGTQSVVAGSLGQYANALNAANGARRPGWPWLSTDTEFSTPAIANLYSNHKNYVVDGAEQTAGSQEAQGGHLWVIDPNGTRGKGSANPKVSGANCAFTPNQGVMSSPAVGKFLKGDSIGITFGTGYDFHTATSLPSDSRKLFGLGPHCGLAWDRTLDGATYSSPALVDALGNNHLQIAEGTTQGFFPGNGSAEGGTAYLIDGATGGVYWSHNVGRPIIGSITSANLGGGHQDLLVPTTDGLVILNGKTGRQVLQLGAGVALLNSAVATDNNNGTVGITIAGTEHGTGMIEHFDILRTSGRLANESGSWPMFHHDAQLTGSTLPRLRA
jgi:PQQ-like domain